MKTNNQTPKRDEIKNRILTLQGIQSELKKLKDELGEKSDDRSLFSKACQGALLTLRCVDRRLRDLLKCPHWTEDDLESCFGCGLKLQAKLEERQDVAKRLNNLRKEWYAQQKHLRKINSKLLDVEERQKLQSLRCTRHGLVFSRMLWKLSGLPFMIEYITANCERDLKELMILMENCIYGFMKTFGGEVPDVRGEEYQYILALCGILTNISSVPDGRHYLMTVPICHDVFDIIIQYLPDVTGCELQVLKWLMLVSIYNITSNPLGLKFTTLHHDLPMVLTECLESQNTVQIIDLTIHIIKRLVEDIRGPKHLRHIFMNYPVERIVEIGKSNEVPGANEPAGVIVLNIGKAFEKYGDRAQLDMTCPNKPCKPPRRRASSSSIPCKSRSSQSIATEPHVKKLRPKPSRITQSIKVRPKARNKTTCTSAIKISAGCVTSRQNVEPPCAPKPIKTTMPVNKNFVKAEQSSPCISTTSLPDYLKNCRDVQIKSSTTIHCVNRGKAQTGIGLPPEKKKSAVETLYSMPDQSKISSESQNIKKSRELCYIRRESTCTPSGEIPSSVGVPKPPSPKREDSKTRTIRQQTGVSKISMPRSAKTKDSKAKTRAAKTEKSPSTKSEVVQQEQEVVKPCPPCESQSGEQKPSTLSSSGTKKRYVHKFPWPQKPSTSTEKPVEHDEDDWCECGPEELDDFQDEDESDDPFDQTGQCVLQEHYGPEEPCQTDSTWNSDDMYENDGNNETSCGAASKLIVSLLSKLDLDKYLRPSYSGKGIPFIDKSKKPLCISHVTASESELEPQKSLCQSIQRASKMILDMMSKLDLDAYMSPSHAGKSYPWKSDQDAKAVLPTSQTESECSSKAAAAKSSKSSQCSTKRVSF